MKTLYITQGSNIVIDESTNSCSSLNTERQSINSIYLVKEPMHVVYGYGDDNEKLSVSKDDIIITFYNNDFKKKIVVVHSPEWADVLKDYNKKIQEEKERWAESERTACESIHR